MKKFLLLVLVVLSVTPLWSQNVVLNEKNYKSVEKRKYLIPLIGDKAPSFVGESTNGMLKFPDDFGKSWKILFSHPQDFTPVCTTEILELANLQNEFDKLGVKLVVVSTDQLDTREHWKKAMEELVYNNRVPVRINFPLVADENMEITSRYGMIHSASNATKSVRGVFIIDPENIVQAIYFYPNSVGRNTDELIRMVTALKTTSGSKVLTPANWRAGNDVLVPVPPDTDPKNPLLAPEGYYNIAWFLWYKKNN